MKSMQLFTWLNEEVSNSNEVTLITQHVDAFLEWGNYEPEEIMAKSADLLLETVEFLREKNFLSKTHPLLVFPLICSNSLRVDLGNFLDEIDDFEPPSLYILGNQREREDVSEEIYRCPCSVKELQKYLNEAEYFLYYKCWRSREGTQSNWEFNRALFAEFKDFAQQ